jgi:hypothetical protein
MAEAARKKQDGEPSDGTSQKKAVPDFESELKATLDWLAEGSPGDPEFGECPEAESVIAHARGEEHHKVSKHLKECAKCRELASYLHQRDTVYQRQREYFLKQIQSEQVEEPWFSSLSILLRETFRPFSFLLNRRAILAETAVLLLAVGLVWKLPSFVATYRAEPDVGAFDPKRALATRKAEADYGRIQQTSPEDPTAAEKIIGELREATQTGGLVEPAKVETVLAAVEMKKTAAPEKSLDWERVGGQLQAYIVLSRYEQLRSEQGKGAPVWKDFVGGGNKDGNAFIYLGREPFYDRETYSLLKQSSADLKGVTGVTLVTPSNKRVALASSAEPQGQAKPD